MDMAGSAGTVEGMAAGGLVVGLVLHVDGEAVGELGAVVGKHGVHRLREAAQEALKEGGRGGGIAARMDLEEDEPSGSVDGDEGVALLAIEAGQMLDVDMDEADRLGIEATDRAGLADALQATQTMPAQAAIDHPTIDRAQASAEHFGDVVEGKRQAGPQLADQPLVDLRKDGGQPMRAVRTIGDAVSPTPAPDRRLADPKLAGKLGD